jgi:hypothetical protein
MPEMPLKLGFENAYATFAIISEIDGRIMPAKTAENVPITKSILSNRVMYLKKVKNPILSGGWSSTTTSSSKSSARSFSWIGSGSGSALSSCFALYYFVYIV